MLIIGKKLSPYALLSISGLLAASDQAVKWLVQQSMAYGEYVSVTPFFNWVHLWNTGAAFSLFANGGCWALDSPRRLPRKVRKYATPISPLIPG